MEKIPDVMRWYKPWLTPGWGGALKGVPLVGRATGMLGNLQIAQMMAEMAGETILNESDSTSFVTT